MSRWTLYFSVGGGSLAIAAGTLGVVLWGTGAMVALAAVGGLILVSNCALVAHDGWKQAVDALAKVTALETRLEAVEKAAEEAKKQANAALTSSSSRPSAQRLSL